MLPAFPDLLTGSILVKKKPLSLLAVVDCLFFAPLPLLVSPGDTETDGSLLHALVVVVAKAGHSFICMHACTLGLLS